MKLGMWLLAAAAGSACGQVIDFETLPSGSVPTDDGFLPISQPYSVDGIDVWIGWDTTGDGLIDTQAQIEQSGEAQGETQIGFFNAGLGLSDTADPGFVNQLGGFFVRRSNSTLREDLFTVLYSEPVFGAGGEIWDLDYHPGDTFERWLITAYASDGTEITSVESPELFSSKIVPDDDNFDGEPWLFSLSSTIGITKIVLEYTGTTVSSVGPFAFNNFSAASSFPGPTLMTHQPDHAENDLAGVAETRLYWSEPVTIAAIDITVEDGGGDPVPFTVAGSGTQVSTITFTGLPGGADTGSPVPLTLGAYSVTVRDTARASDDNAPIDGDNDGVAGGDASAVVTHICNADLADPAGLLDLTDVNAFVDGFLNGCN